MQKLIKALKALPQSRTRTGRAILAELTAEYSIDRDFALELERRLNGAARRNARRNLLKPTPAWTAWTAFASAARIIGWRALGLDTGRLEDAALEFARKAARRAAR